MTDISLLMLKDPLQHTEQDIDAIIQKMREQRHTFNSGVKTAKTAKTTAAAVDLKDISFD